MSNAAAFDASVHSVRTVPSRKVVQVVLEAPIEHHAKIAVVAEHNAWVAVARLQIPKSEATAKVPRQWNDLTPATQAGIRCAEPEFQRYLGVDSEDAAAKVVRERCEVQSRSELSTNKRASAAWERLDSEYQTSGYR